MPKAPQQSSLRDFFESQSGAPIKSASRPRSSERVPGLDVIEDFITEQMERSLLEYLDQQQWRTDLSRRTMHFGGTYCLMPNKSAPIPVSSAAKPEIIQAPPIPPEFDPLLQLFTVAGIYTSTSLPEYCIINEYRFSQGISAHVENFRFDSPICALTLGDGDSMRFQELTAPHDGSVRSGKVREAVRTGRKVDVRMEGRSLLIMRGEARERWQHEIVKRKTGRVGRGGKEWRRVSLTFRVEKKGNMK